jgi:C4-dicarboxylate-binding protein DctP
MEAGGAVRTLNDSQRQAWVKALKPVWAKFEKDVGADTIAAAQSGK